MTMPTSRMRS